LSNIELVAATCGFIAVALTIYRSIWCWPVGLVQVVLYISVFYDAKLYSDALLHVIYIGLQFYGWHQWRQASRSGQQDFHAVRVESLNRVGTGLALATCAALTLSIGWLMATFTDADWPFADAFIAGTSLVAQYLLAKRQLQNWYLWIVVDIVAVFVFSAKALYPTAILYGLFLIMAMTGAIVWHRRLRMQSNVTAGAHP
jgi:nicotinamide mononucleotide transporter